jgi:predicted nucleotidyltransferase
MVPREELFNKITSFLVPLGATRIAIFGSYARSQATRESDLDILVQFVTSKSLLELVRIERELSELLGIKVDLLTEKAISPYLIDRIKEESTVIHG